MVSTAAKRARVLLVDDHPLFRHGLAVALRHESELDIVGEASSGVEALALAKQHQLDLVIMDMLLPGETGISLVSDLLELQPECRMLGLSVVDEPGLIADMLRAGAGGYAVKTQSLVEILQAIRQALAGVRYLPPGISHDAINAELAASPDTPLGRLTKREREVFELVIRGRSNDEIATELFIARRTVETHRQRIIKKLSAHSVVEMQRLAARYGGLGA